MVTLYIHEQGASIRRVNKRIKIIKGDEVLHIIRIRDLDRLVLFGNIDLTSQAMALLLDEGIETVLLTATGRFRGRLEPGEGKNVFLRQAQYSKYADMDFRVSVAKTIIEGKIRNARVILYRHLRNKPDDQMKQVIKDLELQIKNIANQESIEQLMGIEGYSAQIYFSTFSSMLKGEITFNGRSRRPPRDPVNAALSFGYTLLSTELTGLVAAQGLDPYVGLLHDLHYGRPSLALDILEEFRQPVIDRLVLTLANLRVLRDEHFEPYGDGGVYLNDIGRKRFLEYYHRTLDEPFKCKDHLGDDLISYRTLMQRQVQRMRQAIELGSVYQTYNHF